MDEQVRVSAKKPEAKRASSFTPTQKTDVSHSINSPIDQILHLQRTIGNQAVQRLFKSGMIQAKLRIGQPNDKYEQEADRVADEVMRMPEPQVQRQVEPEEEEEEETLQSKPLVSQITPLVQVQRQEEPEEEEETLQSKPLANQITPLAQVQRQEEPEEEEETLQAKPLTEQITPLVQKQVEEEEEPIQTKLIDDAQVQRQEEEEEPIMTKGITGSAYKIRNDLSARLNLSRSGGQPLPEADKSFMERRFSANFSGVRVHTDSNAIQMNKELNAQAFTHGRNIYFGTGRYRPGTSSGKRLLAHELTHVVQQRSNLRNQQAEGIQRQKEMPEWKKREKKFEQLVLDLKPRKPKSNMEKFNLGLNKLFVTLGHKKTLPFLLPKLHVTPKGRLLWLFVTKTGTALWLMKQGKLPNIIPSIKLRRNLLLDVEPGGTFKKPKLMLKLKWTFRGL